MKIAYEILNEEKNHPFSVYLNVLLKDHEQFLEKHIHDGTLNFNKHITKGEYPFIMMLYHKKHMNQLELAQTYQVSQANVARIIRHLEDLDVIERTVDEDNRRKKIVSLTPIGEEICINILNLEKKWQESVLEVLPDNDVEALNKMLKITSLFILNKI